VRRVDIGCLGRLDIASHHKAGYNPGRLSLLSGAACAIAELGAGGGVKCEGY